MANRQKTILFCDNTLWGLVNFRGDVIRHLAGEGYKVVLCAPNTEDKQMRTTLPDSVAYEPISMGRTSKSPINDLKYMHRLWKVFKKVNPDYIFTYTIKPNIYGSILSHYLHRPLTAMMPGMGYAFTNDSLPARTARWLYRYALQYATNLFVLNEENKALVLRRGLIDADKIILLKGGEGVNLKKFPYYDNDSDETIFLFIGRILWEKGYEEFSQAARIVKKKYPNVKFELLGSLDPSYPKSVSTERVRADEAEGILEYKGFTHDMNSVYQRKGIVVTLPSFYGEGMNRSLMEACAVGKPIITTDIAGCREIVEDGKNGFLIPVKDSEALADAMLKYLALSKEEKKQFSANSRLYAEQRFDINKVYEIYNHIIEN